MEIFVKIIFAAFLISIAWTDFKTQMIYDKILLPMAVTGIFFDACNFLVELEDAILFSALGFIFMFVIFKISRGGMGGGDVKFSAVLGLWLGEKIFAAIFFASCLAAIFALFSLIKNRDIKIKLPFGPFLSAGSFVVKFFHLQGVLS